MTETVLNKNIYYLTLCKRRGWVDSWFGIVGAWAVLSRTRFLSLLFLYYYHCPQADLPCGEMWLQQFQVLRLDKTISSIRKGSFLPVTSRSKESFPRSLPSEYTFLLNSLAKIELLAIYKSINGRSNGIM